MAKQDKRLKRFFDIIENIRAGRVPSKEDLKFYYEYVPEVDQAKIDEYAASNGTDNELATEAIRQASIALQSDPSMKEATIEMAKDNEKGKMSEKLSAGLNLILAGSDIAQSINQITQSNKALSKSKKPTRPAVPQRDSYLEQALRGAQDVNTGVQAALAPVQAQIQDQYLEDIANAKTASGGQASNFGAYAQVAANRRKRAAMELAPITDQVRARNQNRLDSLNQARMQETQNMFENQAQLYPYDLYQYNQDQETAAALGSQGRSNLRNSLANFADQIAPAVSNYYTQRKYRNLRNSVVSQLGDSAGDIADKNQQYLDEYYYGYNPNKPELRSQDIYNYGG